MKQGSMPDAVILCGGLGTRLRSVVSEKPKVLADVNGRPFLDYLIDALSTAGFSRIILAVGHLSDQIINHYRHDPRIVFSLESSPLGTGGALKNAEPLITTDHFFVTNGDSIVNFNHGDVFKFHKEKGGIVSLVVEDADGREDVGNVICDESMRATSFFEKDKKDCGGNRFVSSGAYFMNRKIFDYLPEVKPASLEYDLFPAVARDGLCWGYRIEDHALDIGTPDRYRNAEHYLEA